MLAHENLRTHGFFRVRASTAPRRYCGICVTPAQGKRCSTLWCARTWAARTTCSGATMPAWAIITGATRRTKFLTSCPNLGIRSVLTLEWWYCPDVRRRSLRGHLRASGHQAGPGGTVDPQHHIGRNRAGSANAARRNAGGGSRECAKQYGFGSPFVTEKYLTRAHTGPDGARGLVRASSDHASWQPILGGH